MITRSDYVTAKLNLWLQQITKLMQQAMSLEYCRPVPLGNKIPAVS